MPKVYFDTLSFSWEGSWKNSGFSSSDKMMQMVSVTPILARKSSCLGRLVGNLLR